jgi:hypothetical protein
MMETDIELIRKKLEKYRYVDADNTDSKIHSLEIGFSSLKLKDNDIKEHNFQSSTSNFNSNDMSMLSITVKEIYQLEDFLSYSHIAVEMEERETLYDVARRVGEYECRRFDLELERVLENNKQKQVFSTREDYYCFNPNESYIDSFADTIFRISSIYDAKRFELLRPKNSLYICNKRYGSSVDRELRVLQTGMVFMIEESKHIGTSSYLKGDLQLACNLIVSHQQNKTTSSKTSGLLKPLSTVFAIKILAAEVFLYFMNYDEEYLEYLEKGQKKKEITMYKFLYNRSSINMAYINHVRFLLNVLSNVGEAVLRSSVLMDYSETHL